MNTVNQRTSKPVLSDLALIVWLVFLVAFLTFSFTFLIEAYDIACIAAGATIFLLVTALVIFCLENGRKIKKNE